MPRRTPNNLGPGLGALQPFSDLYRNVGIGSKHLNQLLFQQVASGTSTVTADATNEISVETVQAEDHHLFYVLSGYCKENGIYVNQGAIPEAPSGMWPLQIFMTYALKYHTSPGRIECVLKITNLDSSSHDVIYKVYRRPGLA